MFTRLSLLAGMTWTVACATTPGSLQLLPEPTFVALAPAEAAPAAAPIEAASELASAWRPADLAAPTGPRDVVYTEPGELPQLYVGALALPPTRVTPLSLCDVGLCLSAAAAGRGESFVLRKRPGNPTPSALAFGGRASPPFFERRKLHTGTNGLSAD